jgi:enoyl-CoA hydratase/carnithine racemase
MTDLVKSFLLNNVLHVELNRPDKYHAMTTEMYAALTDIFADARDNDEVRVLLFKGGKDCFCAGNDIADFLNTPVLSEGNEVLAYLHELANFDKPLVAAVSGPAIGIATTFLLHCDLIYATEKSVFSTPFVNLGICPEAASTYLLPRHIGYTKSAELLFLGERFDAAKALDLGLITAIIPALDYWEYAQTQAESIAKKPVNALRATKRLLRADSAAIHQTIDREAKIFVGLRDSEEARAIFEQFLKK